MIPPVVVDRLLVDRLLSIVEEDEDMARECCTSEGGCYETSKSVSIETT